METKEFYKLDLYSIIGVDELASDKEILKGYRKRALKCHPDKNPDNPKAAEEFHQLFKALEVLTDAAARAAYDQSRKAKKAALERTRVLDSKRKKFKEDLEAREQAFFEQTERAKELQAEKKLQAEIERLRREGSRLLEQEQERLREELKKSSQQAETSQDPAQESPEKTGDIPRIKLKWKAQKSDSSNGGYDSTKLSDIFSCYGKMSALIVSSKRNGSAIVEFDKPGVSCDILDEVGLTENPFTMTWLSGKPSNTNGPQTFQTSSSFDNVNSCNFSTVPESSISFGVENSRVFSAGGGASSVDSSDKDFESVVLRNMRLAEERKKLIQQMMKEDAEGD